jgi:hypothetical protein
MLSSSWQVLRLRLGLEELLLAGDLAHHLRGRVHDGRTLEELIERQALLGSVLPAPGFGELHEKIVGRGLGSVHKSACQAPEAGAGQLRDILRAPPIPFPLPRDLPGTDQGLRPQAADMGHLIGSQRTDETGILEDPIFHDRTRRTTGKTTPV